MSNRFAPLSETPSETPVERALVIGDSILWHVKLASPLGALVVVSCRAPDSRRNLKLLAIRRYLRIVIHVGTNNVRLRQSEVTKDNIKEMCKLSQAML